MSTQTYSVTIAAKAAGVARGTLGCWRVRGHVPSRDYDLGDLCSLTVANDLVKMGLAVEAAAEIGWLCREHWDRVLEAVPKHRQLVLLTRQGDDGKWIVLICPWSEVPRPCRPGSFLCDLTDVARSVLARLDDIARMKAADA